MSRVHHAHSVAEYSELLRSSADKLVVVMWTASWCGPCQAIKPYFAELSTRFPNVTCVMVDVDENQQLTQSAGVASMPTFHALKKGAKVDGFSGANKEKLLALFTQHEVKADPAAAAVHAATGGHASLNEYINKTGIECLNQDLQHPVANIFKNDESHLASDCDEQIIIGIQFNQAVKLHSLRVTGTQANPEQAPKTIRTYVNRLTLSFDDTDSVEPTEILVLNPQQAAGKDLIPLRFVRYQNVTSIVIFIEDNLAGDDVTKLAKLEFFGTPLDATKDVSELKKMDGSGLGGEKE